MVYPGLIHVDVWHKPTQYSNYPSIKKKSIFEKIKREIKCRICIEFISGGGRDGNGGGYSFMEEGLLS